MKLTANHCRCLVVYKMNNMTKFSFLGHFPLDEECPFLYSIPVVERRKRRKNMKYKDLYNAAKREDFIKWLNNNKKYKIWEIHALKTFKQNPSHHPEGDTVYDHVIAALNDYKGTDPIVKLAILFHDIGKPITAEPSLKGDWCHFYGHDKEGELVFKRISKKYQFPNDVTEAISFVIRNHMRFYKITEMKTSKIKALVNSPYWKLLVRVAYHDDHCRGVHSSTKDFKKCYKHALKIKKQK